MVDDYLLHASQKHLLLDVHTATNYANLCKNNYLAAMCFLSVALIVVDFCTQCVHCFNSAYVFIDMVGK